MEPPKIKCPNLKDKWAEPAKLTARVTWDTPEGVDTADGILTESVSLQCTKPAVFLLVIVALCTGGSLWKIKTLPVFCSVILKGKPSKSNFPEGLHKMSYTVFDRAGNKGSCRFTVRVRGDLIKAFSSFCGGGFSVTLYFVGWFSGSLPESNLVLKLRKKMLF